jgi:hypothetical protein
LLPEFGFEKLLAELGTLESTMAIEDSEEPNAIGEVWISYMGILLQTGRKI